MLDISLPMLNKCLAKKLPHVLRFDFLKVRSIHFRKLHHLMFHTTVLRVSSASICRPPSVKPTSTRRRVPITHLRVDLTRGRVCFTHQRVAAADRRVSASSASSSCRKPPVEFKAPFIGAWCSRAVVKGPCRRCTIMLFVFPCFFWACCCISLLLRIFCCIFCCDLCNGYPSGVWILRILQPSFTTFTGGPGSWHPFQGSIGLHLRKHCLRVLSFIGFNVFFYVMGCPTLV
jgi:hypothetical protein